MITAPWQLLLAIFWFGMFVEAAIGNMLGRVSSFEGLYVDIAIMIVLLAWAKKKHLEWARGSS